MPFTVLYQDDDLVIIDKPEGFHVHRPEDRRIKVAKDRIIVHQLRDQLGKPASPVHRLDAATSGLMIWALNKEAASKLSAQFMRERSVRKKYWALTRGWVDDLWSIELPLELDSTGDLVPAATKGSCLARLEIHEPVGKRYPTARYSWLEAEPQTGRYRQIRRHMHRSGHPIVGDSDYGDAFHNRFFREKLGLPGLFLRAIGLSFRHPVTDAVVDLQAPAHPKWEALRALATVHAFTGPVPRRPLTSGVPASPAPL